jgi:hypothetical protein
VKQYALLEFWETAEKQAKYQLEVLSRAKERFNG